MNEKNSMFDGLEDDMIPMFADRLKQIRTQSGLTQQQFAAKLGISVAALSYYETGKRVPDIIFLRKISEYFMIPAEYFLGITDSTKKENISISNKLGLSDAAIEKLHKYVDRGDYEETADVINALLENDDFYSVLNLIMWTGYESFSFLPDENFISFAAMKKMMNVIQNVVDAIPNPAVGVVRAIYPDQKERADYYKWLLDDKDKKHQNAEQSYQKYREKQEKAALERIEEYKKEQFIRRDALDKLKEAENNGKHNPEDQ